MYSFCSFTMGHFVTWWAFVWRKSLWSSMADKRNSLQSLFIERWVCACFYTSFIVVLSRNRSNGFRLVLLIPKAWVFNVLLISSHWLLHMTAVGAFFWWDWAASCGNGLGCLLRWWVLVFLSKGAGAGSIVTQLRPVCAQTYAMSAKSKFTASKIVADKLWQAGLLQTSYGRQI